MRSAHPIPPRANDDPASPPAAPPQSDWYKLIISRCIAFAGPIILGLLMLIFLALPTETPLELGRNPDSSVWSLNISMSYNNLITVEFAHMKLLSSFDGQLALSRPSLVSNSTQAPGCGTSLQAKTQTTLSIITDLGFNGMDVTIEVAAKAKRRLRLGLWWVAVLDVDVSTSTYLTSTAQSNSEGSSDQMILEGTLSCSLDLIPQLWYEKLQVPA